MGIFTPVGRFPIVIDDCARSRREENLSMTRKNCVHHFCGEKRSSHATRESREAVILECRHACGQSCPTFYSRSITTLCTLVSSRDPPMYVCMYVPRVPARLIRANSIATINFYRNPVGSDQFITLLYILNYYVQLKLVFKMYFIYFLMTIFVTVKAVHIYNRYYDRFYANGD